MEKGKNLLGKKEDRASKKQQKRKEQQYAWKSAMLPSVIKVWINIFWKNWKQVSKLLAH